MATYWSCVEKLREPTGDEARSGDTSLILSALCWLLSRSRRRRFLVGASEAVAPLRGSWMSRRLLRLVSHLRPATPSLPAYTAALSQGPRHLLSRTMSSEAEAAALVSHSVLVMSSETDRERQLGHLTSASTRSYACLTGRGEEGTGGRGRRERHAVRQDREEGDPGQRDL